LKSLLLAVAQLRAVRADKDANLQKIAGVMEKAASAGAQAILFPELALTGYVIHDDIRPLAEPRTGPSLRRLGELDGEPGPDAVLAIVRSHFKPEFLNRLDDIVVFRSLGSAILVAVFGAIFLGFLNVAGRPLVSLDALIAEAAKNGTAIGPVFGYVFGTAAVTLTIGFLCFLAMEERPLRGR